MKSPLRTMLRHYPMMRDMTHHDVAAMIGITAPALSRFLSGKGLDEQNTLKLIAWLFAPEGAAP